jgi:hypothetical protein
MGRGRIRSTGRRRDPQRADAEGFAEALEVAVAVEHVEARALWRDYH